jgi:hypothetical protein
MRKAVVKFMNKDQSVQKCVERTQQDVCSFDKDNQIDEKGGKN